jgi:hypothetical protein
MAEATTAITDLVGNHLSGVLRWPFTTTAAPPPPDVTAPVVSGTTPVNGTTNVALDTNVTVTFSEAMLSGTINSTNIYLSNTSGGTAILDTVSVTLNPLDKKTVTLDPVNDLTEGNIYYINVTTGVQDLAANAMAAADRERNFSTIYNFQEVYNITGSSGSSVFAGDDERMGLLITSATHLLVSSAKPPKRFTLRLKKTGSPTGTATLRIRNAADTIVATIGTINVATLTTSYADYTITSLSQSVLVEDGYRIMLEYSGGNSSNYIQLQRTSSSDASNVRLTKWDSSGGYTDESSEDIAWIIYV